MAGGGADEHGPGQDPETQLDETAHRARLLQAGRMLAGVIHEIKNPLAAIEGYAQLLHQRCKEQADEEDLAAILKETRRMAGLIDDMLTFARRGAEQGTTVDLCRVVSTGLNLARHEMRRASIAVVARVPAEPVLVRANQGVCIQVLLNLLENARHSLEAERPRDRGITIQLEAGSGPRVGLIVANNGPPIPAELTDSIFDPFFTTKEDGAGTGLGLALCRDLLARFDATIQLEPSDNGSRASFRLEFPRA